MSAVVLMLIAIVAVVVAYFTHGTFVAARLGLDDRNVTPAHTREDGVDFVPSARPVVLGHHFASIAGAGPIVGPIIAISFGWLPAFLWILIGVVFIGAVHDVTTLTASIRHGGRTISDIIEDYVGVPAKRLFLLFGFAALILVVGVFTDIVAKTFVSKPEVATTSGLFIALAVAFGVLTRRSSVSMWITSAIGVAALVGCIALGRVFPLNATYEIWGVLILGYVAVAAVAPVWILLQPRDYLNSFLLYGMMGAGILGLFVATPVLEFEAYNGLRHETLGFIFPILFVTVACGAISGFHSLVASGTTSKQLDRESDAKFIGYGGMLLEGVLAVLALVAAGMMNGSQHAMALRDQGPIAIFSNGVGAFIGALGVDPELAISFVALAVSVFALTSLDTCTRLGRLLFAEFFTTAEIRSGASAPTWLQHRFVGTAVVVALGGLLTFSGQFMAVWPLFGAANQLLAALSLLSVAVWLAKKGIRNTFVVVPMVFMFGVTFVALGQLLWKNFQAGNWVLAVLSAILLALSLVLVAQSAQASFRRDTAIA